ncbi:MAG: enoyl-CoA hydratase-related protein [Acidimicrobiia bacterium]|nr:enoyl-CoA hydratase-related protein [Acidimicrobiia bacterium]
MAVRSTTEGRVRVLTLDRVDAYNTITEQVRLELDEALDAAHADDDVHCILLRAEGPAFCAGYDLDWGVSATVAEEAWDPTLDYHRIIGPFVATYLKLFEGPIPVVAAVQGWCLGGGTDMVLCADLVLAADDAVFGYPPARVWGVPTTGMWVHRLGLEQAKRYLLTGDEIPASEAARTGLILEAVPARELDDRAADLAGRIARLPRNQLALMKLMLNRTVRDQIEQGRLLGTLFDGIARHTPEGTAWVERAMHEGVRSAVRERDEPFGDYGSRPPD